MSEQEAPLSRLSGRTNTVLTNNVLERPEARQRKYLGQSGFFSNAVKHDDYTQ